MSTTQVLASRAVFVERARGLARLGVLWHGVEAAVAIGAGVVASSIALVGFGADSVIELLAGGILLWRFSSTRADSHRVEHTSRRLIGVSFYLVALYIAVVAIDDLWVAKHPDTSLVGIGLSLVTLTTMPPLARAKARNAERLHSPAAKGESRQTMLCAYLSAALLAGLGLNALVDWWWADPVAALVMAAVAVREGRATWRGDGSCCSPL